MGVNIVELFDREEISLDNLFNKKIVVDSYNQLYQFLTTIRQRDGAPLMDSQNRITSHLTGLFSRTTNLIDKNIQLAFVFDGKPPKLKQEERERRKDVKKDAEKKYKIAADKEDIDEMKKYASRTSRLTEKMVEEAKELISALGLPVIQAPSEGEAQAAYMVKKGEFFGLASQDIDGLLFSTPNLIRNISVAGKRKKTNTLAYETIKPEMINLSKNLNKLGIDHNQLIVLGILVGTDYNIGGVKKIGPKNALKLVKQFGTDFDGLFKSVNWEFGVSWKKVFDLIKNIPTTDDYTLKWGEPDEDKIRELLIEKHDFSKERVEKTLERLSKTKDTKQQKGLGDFF